MAASPGFRDARPYSVFATSDGKKQWAVGDTGFF
jgi:hypothetical protein